MVKQLDLSNVTIYETKKRDMVEAIDLIGQDVYVSNDVDFSKHHKCKLVEVNCVIGESYTSLYPFVGEYKASEKHVYKYFILAKDAKFIEGQPKKLRPFKSSWEFTDVTGCNIGDVITIRRLDKIFEESCVVNGYKLLDTGPSTPHCVYISLGANEYSLVKLMRCFEYAKGDEWYPFGVEE